VLVVDFNDGGAVAGLERAARRLATEQGKVLDPIGRDILRRGHDDFATKSAGGTGSDGITWRPLTARTVRRKHSDAIGIRTGELAATEGDVLVVSGNSVRAGFGDRHAAAFDAIRPLLPSRLPGSWRRDFESRLQRWGQAILDEEIGR
jgi:hypothetical protein